MSQNCQEQPFFIVGSDRSGTTLLRLMIDTHPRLRIPRESWFISDLMDRLPLNSSLSREQQKLAFDLISNHHRWKDWEFPDEKLKDVIFSLESPKLGDLVDAVFINCGNPDNKPRWGDKTPRYVQDIDRLHQVFPHAKFIHLIRDGRDVCLSLMNTKWHGISIEEIAGFWCEQVGAGIESGRKLGESTYLEINYKDLILNSEATLQKICQFIGEEYDPQMLEYQKVAERELTDSQKQRGIHDNTKQKPIESKVDRWRREMNPTSVAIFEAAAGPTMDRVGIERLYKGFFGRAAVYAIAFGYNSAIKTRTFRKRWGLQIPYGMMKKLGVVGDSIYKKTDSSDS